MSRPRLWLYKSCGLSVAEEAPTYLSVLRRVGGAPWMLWMAEAAGSPSDESEARCSATPLEPELVLRRSSDEDEAPNQSSADLAGNNEQREQVQSTLCPIFSGSHVAMADQGPPRRCDVNCVRVERGVCVGACSSPLGPGLAP